MERGGRPKSAQENGVRAKVWSAWMDHEYPDHIATTAHERELWVDLLGEEAPRGRN